VSNHHLARLISLALTLPLSERGQFPTRSAIITGRVLQFTFPVALDEARLSCEMEADGLAVRWLERAGYRATALATLLNNITERLSPQQQRQRLALRTRISKLNDRLNSDR
jgi:predicted Zn-dependent protease